MINANVTKKAAEFIGEFEGCELRPYLDPIGIPTIGFGTTIYPNGIRVTMNDKDITKEQALTYLQVHLYGVLKSLNGLVQVSLSDNEAVAIVSLIYNIGIGNFKKSKLLQHINQGVDHVQEIDFTSWNKAGGKVLNGLIKRRTKEWELFSA